MIYEMRTYDLKPRTLAEVIKRFGEAYEKRRKFSELYAFWYTEIGPFNQIMHVWPYQSLDQRMELRKRAIESGMWPPPLGQGDAAYSLITQETKIMLAAPFSPLQ